MKKRRLRDTANLCVQSHNEKPVVSVTSPYFCSNQINSDKVEFSSMGKRHSSHRVSLPRSSKTAKPTNPVTVEDSLRSHHTRSDMISKDIVKSTNKKSTRKPSTRIKRNKDGRNMPIDYHSNLTADDPKETDWFTSSVELESDESDDSYQPKQRGFSTCSGHVKQKNTKPRRKKVKEQSVERAKTDKMSISSSQVVEDGNNTDSSDAVQPETAIKRRKRTNRKSNLLLFSEFTKPTVSGEPPKLVNASPDQTHENTDDDDWEDVEDQAVGEADFMTALLQARSKAASEDAENPHPDSTLTIAVPTSSTSHKCSNKDPAVAEAQARARQLKEAFLSMHLVHVMCFLAHSRYLNQICDSSVYRGLGLSLLGTVSAIRRKRNSIADSAEWTVEHLAACVIPFLTHHSTEPQVDDKDVLTIQQRILAGTCTLTDCVLLFVSALRTLNFDVRLIVALTPLPLKPFEAVCIDLNTKNSSPQLVDIKPTKRATMAKVNRKIISSDDESDFEPVTNKRPRKPPASFPHNPRHYVFAEVFLPKLMRWVCVDFSKPTGLVDTLPRHPFMLYVLGMTTTHSTSPSTQHYVGRNPVDLAARYDPDWCILSRAYRLPADRWSKLLDYQRAFFDLDAAYTSSLLPQSESLITTQRDRTDEDTIRSELLNKPLPNKMQDFKNHPLYVLQRHLLKFEVIHPPDAIPLGFFRGEPVYSRDCLHLCHTRESWLKEAKMVRLHEKPAKVVKARLSLKRKLLQGSDSTPPMVEVFGSWQVEDYQPPVAENGVVPRNAHGTIDLFKPCMLPIGCVHICLTGIQHIAKKLGIDCAPAVTGWHFHGAGWAIPIVDGYVVCKEAVPALIDAWHTTRMNAVKAAVEERSERAVENWRRLVRGLFLWHRVKAQFALAPLHSASNQPEQEALRSKSVRKRKPKPIEVKPAQSQCMDSIEVAPDQVGSLVMEHPPHSDVCGWQRLDGSELAHTLPVFPVASKLKLEQQQQLPLKRRRTKKEKTAGPVPSKPRARKGKQRRKRGKRRVEPSSTEDSESEPNPSTTDTDTKPDEEEFSE